MVDHDLTVHPVDCPACQEGYDPVKRIYPTWEHKAVKKDA